MDRQKILEEAKSMLAAKDQLTIDESSEMLDSLVGRMLADLQLPLQSSDEDYWKLLHRKDHNFDLEEYPDELFVVGVLRGLFLNRYSAIVAKMPNWSKFNEIFGEKIIGTHRV